MSTDQITANFKAAHKQAVIGVADAQHTVMEAQAKLAAARKVQSSLEKQYRLDMAEAQANPQLELAVGDTKKK